MAPRSTISTRSAWRRSRAHEHELIEQTVAGLRTIPGIRLIGAPRERAGVVSFVVDGCRTEDVGKALDREGIAVRAGHHCAQPILRRFGLESTVRPSFALYNTAEDVEALIAAVRRIALQAQGARAKRGPSGCRHGFGNLVDII